MALIRRARVLFLNVRGIDEHELREILRAGRAEHAAAKPLGRKPRQVADVIEVRVGQHDGINRVRAHGQLVPVAPAQLVLPLEEAAVDEHAGRPNLDQILGARDRAGGSQKRELRHECAIMTGV